MRVESPLDGEFCRLSGSAPGSRLRPYPSSLSSFAPAQRVLGHAAADDGGHAFAGDRLRPRSLYCVRLRRRPATDAYVAGFTIPDWLNYLVAGGTASITFVSIYTRFLAENREEDAQKTFSIIITVMTAVLGRGSSAGGDSLLRKSHAIFFPSSALNSWNSASTSRAFCCPRRSSFMSVAWSRRYCFRGGCFCFLPFPRCSITRPSSWAACCFRHRFGIASLAYGALAGSFLGPFLINAIGAARIGTGYSISFDVRNPAFREWVKLSIPLMLGVSLVTADDWILRYFASGAVGDITRLNYAKRLFAVPIAVLGQATSQASLPFFAKLFGEKRLREFADTVNGSIYRIVATSLLATSFMMAAALPLIDLVYRRGHFQFSDSQETALYFFWFALSLCFWSAQGLYSRAFYAAGNTLVPMVASSLITVASIPIYSALFHKFSTVGLAMASDLGIVANTLALALLLHRRQLVRVNELNWAEIGKAGVTSLVAGLAELSGRSRPAGQQ